MRRPGGHKAIDDGVGVMTLTSEPGAIFVCIRSILEEECGIFTLPIVLELGQCTEIYIKNVPQDYFLFKGGKLH